VLLQLFFVVVVSYYICNYYKIDFKKAIQKFEFPKVYLRKNRFFFIDSLVLLGGHSCKYYKIDFKKAIQKFEFPKEKFIYFSRFMGLGRKH